MSAPYAYHPCPAEREELWVDLDLARSELNEVERLRRRARQAEAGWRRRLDRMVKARADARARARTASLVGALDTLACHLEDARADLRWEIRQLEEETC